MTKLLLPDMAKIKPTEKDVDKPFLNDINFSNQKKLWFSTDFLERIGILDKKEVGKLHKVNIDYLLVGIIKQEYQKDGFKIISTTTTLDLLNGNFHAQKLKVISIEDIRRDYEQTLFHIYIESTQSPQSEILRFVKDSDFLKVSTHTSTCQKHESGLSSLKKLLTSLVMLGCGLLKEIWTRREPSLRVLVRTSC